MTARDHNKLLGIFFLVNGGLSAFGAIVFALTYGGIGTMMLTSAKDQGAQTVGGVFMVVGAIVGIFILAFSVFYLITGWKVYKEAEVGRMLGIVASILSLWSFPLGTALGVYGLWFFFGDQGKAFYEGANFSERVPPPPNNWQ